jgi:hypothetical protein
MSHRLCRVTAIKSVSPFTLDVTFDDGVVRTIDFRPCLVGTMYGPLRDLQLFNQVRIDPEAHTLIWPNGADFDPATLRDWPDLLSEILTRAEQWKESEPHAENTGVHAVTT